jgi:hypothetical protein
MGQDNDQTRPDKRTNWRDPRLYQIISLSVLLLYGLLWLDFDVSLGQTAVTIGTALLTQYAGTRFYNLPSFDPRSPLISALSLCLLLRTNHLAVAALASCIAIGSKFVVRWKDKHVFNPTNLALVVVLASGLGWISPGQWGQVAWFGFLIACLGSLVVTRAARADVTLAFLVFYVGLLFARALWLGDPLTIPLHQIENGALLIFAFFMISDPKTTPDSRTGRILLAILIATAAVVLQFGWYVQTALLWALAGGVLVVPVLDRLWRGTRYEWATVSQEARGTRLGGEGASPLAPSLVPANRPLTFVLSPTVGERTKVRGGCSQQPEGGSDETSVNHSWAHAGHSRVGS